MSARTKTRRTKSTRRSQSIKRRSPQKEVGERSVSWREAAKDNIEKYTEQGLYLRGFRQREGLTQKELAEKIRAKQPHICAMEHGKRPIGKQTAKKFAELFDTDYRMFL